MTLEAMECARPLCIFTATLVAVIEVDSRLTRDPKAAPVKGAKLGSDIVVCETHREGVTLNYFMDDRHRLEMTEAAEQMGWTPDWDTARLLWVPLP